MLVCRFWIWVLLCSVIAGAAIGGKVAFAAAGLPRSAAQVSGFCVRVTGSGAPVVNSWVTLRITLPNLRLPDAEVQIQDARGGLAICRDFGLLKRHFLIPLPYVAGADGNSGNWPVIVKILAAGKMVRSWHYSVPMRPAGAKPAWVMAVPRQLQSHVHAVAAAIGKQLVPLVISRRQLARSPVLNFASCRGMLLDRAATSVLSRRRVLALLSLGVRFVCTGEKPLRIFPAAAWRQAGNTAGGRMVWATPAFDGFGDGPQVVQPHLADLRIAPLKAPITWSIVAWAIGPLAIIMIILLHWAVPRQAGFILILAISLALLSAVGIFWLDETTGVTQTTSQWKTLYAPGPLALRNTVTVCRSLQSGNYQTLDPAAIMLPLAWSPRAWFAFHGQITLGRNSSHLAYPITRSATILGYEPQAVVGPDLPVNAAKPSTLQAALSHAVISSRRGGVIFFKGRIFDGKSAHRSHDYYNWLKAQNPSAQAALHLWLLLQFNPLRRYYLIPRSHPITIVALPGN